MAVVSFDLWWIVERNSQQNSGIVESG